MRYIKIFVILLVTNKYIQINNTRNIFENSIYIYIYIYIIYVLLLFSTPTYIKFNPE